MALLRFNEENGWLSLVPESGSTLTQKCVVLSRRSNRRQPREAYHEGSGMLTNRRQVDAIEKDEREFYVRMRDSWITVANRYEFLDAVDEQGAPAGRPRSAAGQYIPHP